MSDGRPESPETVLPDRTASLDEADAPAEAEPLKPLLEPRDGTPDPIDTAEGLTEALDRLRAGSGPVAVDVERASAYRYTSRAYLVQLRREGSGTMLIDPLPFDGLAPLSEVLDGVEWVLHAASQDLPSLAGEGLRPAKLFDTELAGRLLGYPRVNLGSMVAEVLGFELEKGHSAADWSKRPLPQPWLRYAALDVELLVELRDRLEEQLADAGKLDWAREEFAALAASEAPGPRTDPWRRTSGIHRLRRPRQLAIVRALWVERDAIARARDTAPGRILADSAIVEMAATPPRSVRELSALPGFANSRSERRHTATWITVVRAAQDLPEAELPPATTPLTGPPPPRSWGDRNPEAAARLAALREAVAQLADQHGVPAENLLTPEAVRRLAWEPPPTLDTAAVAEALRATGAREWQVAATAEVFADRLAHVGESANSAAE